jgi:diguanylate cyclase (GGDEF)-like protein
MIAMVMKKGDKVLVDCAARIRSSLRESDFVARVGGDEFVVLTFGECDKTSLSEVARQDPPQS